MSEDEALPYGFDLFWDIKTRSQLAEHVAKLERELAEIKEMMEDHGIRL